MNQLPAYLQNALKSSLAEAPAAGIGSMLPPHISIRGNRFTLIDANGGKQDAGQVIDVCIVDRSPHMCKMFFAEEWRPGSEEPPMCFSMNGIGPSREALEPQAPTCALCSNNVRGNATSKLTGKGIKPCRDELKFAVFVLGLPKEMLFQFTLTPGSFKHWKTYADQFVGQPVDVSLVVTRLTFQEGVNGVVQFTLRPWVQGGPPPYIDEATATMRQRAISSKATDLYVGRLDVPIGALPAPAARVEFGPSTGSGATATLAVPAEQVVTTVAWTPPPHPYEARSQQGTLPSDPIVGSVHPQGATMPPAAEPPRRTRRTKAQMEADAAAAAAARQGQAPFPSAAAGSTGQPAHQVVPGAAPVAPFRPQAPVEQAPQQFIPPQGNGVTPGQFGIQAGASPGQDMEATLRKLFPAP